MYKIELSRKAAKFYQKADTVTAKRLNLAFQDSLKIHYRNITSKNYQVSCRAAIDQGKDFIT